jgi:AcrR family transcriptional regulator
LARPVAISDATILTAALDVFLRHGIQATTAEVAHRAGVSEGSIFKRYKTKEELFQAAMRAATPDDLEWIASLPGRIGKGKVETTLEETALGAIKLFRTIIPLMMMCWSNRKGGGIAGFVDKKKPPQLVTIERLAAYFTAEMKLGRLVKHNPVVAARTLLGAVWNFAFLELMFGAQPALSMSAEAYARELSQLLCTGILPKRAVKPRVRKAI